MTLQCYNKGCGTKFDPKQTQTVTSCQYHPGVPVFHDALKGWSCCSKRSTDFTEFLNIKGCTTGPHCNEKPPEPEKPESKPLEDEIIVVQNPIPVMPKPVVPLERPSGDEPLQRLKVTVGASLKEQLEKLKLEEKQDCDLSVVDPEAVAIGTQCKNNGCRGTYTGQPSSEGECQYHPGVPIFHEGMKFWSCCIRRTSDFNNFLNQEGCQRGKHCWVKTKEEKAAEASCRVDWHQTGNIVCISIFAKNSDPEQSYFEANKVTLKAYIVFDKDSSIFNRTFTLRQGIKPEYSEVKMLGSKVEINLRKAEPFSWPSLEVPMEQPSVSKQDE
ncbi:cysteine and histidine-rich domain-containing protein 1-like [Pomacea canaliculata]|uniref:cysteine and histidine-rich domain-containing protein 1-like n=1 Tax=Pomacea canaliculata TaxID=400727 RepID=UPI000D736474|nr:cysteine and histidine-rich domain-containing protein 1-like [Pomacea canaliculata]